MKLNNTLVIFFLICGLCNPAFATNVGTFGQTYSIIEMDFLNFIHGKLKSMQENGEWQKIENQFRNNVARHADRPFAVTTLSVAAENKTWDYDPSITIPYDLHGANGNVIAKAGTTINPLNYINLHNSLLFFNGDDIKQRLVANKINQVLKGKVKFVLVNGSISENEKNFNKPIYFDQDGRLIKKFNIQHVPALVWQNASVLKISEIKP